MWIFIRCTADAAHSWDRKVFRRRSNQQQGRCWRLWTDSLLSDCLNLLDPGAAVGHSSGYCYSRRMSRTHSAETKSCPKQ